jgi:hypothetical protein
MLDLEDPRWGELEQAYGTAEDIPRLLAHLPGLDERARGELWLGLWSTLCRDGDVYSASYAAVPHLVAFAARQSVAAGAESLHLVGAIEVGRLSAGAPGMPSDLGDDYRGALGQVPRLIAEWAAEPWGPDTAQVLSAVLAIAKGHPRFGAAALLLEPAVVCPLCGGSHAPAGWDLGAGG